MPTEADCVFQVIGNKFHAEVDVHATVAVFPVGKQSHKVAAFAVPDINFASVRKRVRLFACAARGRRHGVIFHILADVQGAFLRIVGKSVGKGANNYIADGGADLFWQFRTGFGHLHHTKAFAVKHDVTDVLRHVATIAVKLKQSGKHVYRNVFSNAMEVAQYRGRVERTQHKVQPARKFRRTGSKRKHVTVRIALQHVQLRLEGFG